MNRTLLRHLLCGLGLAFFALKAGAEQAPVAVPRAEISGLDKQSSNGPNLPMALPPQSVSELVKEYSGSLVFIEGSNGSGSGFVGNFKGKTQIFTNLHVLAHVENAILTRLDRSPLELGAGEAAVDHDVGRLAVSPQAKALECMEDVEKNAVIGDKIVVLGNAEGAHVINPISGKLVGIGPDLVEVDAPFLPGNSGSPIIDVRTGQVIGIATYATVREMSALTSDSHIKRVRRFGYRVDSITQWQPIRWPQFLSEGVQNRKSEKLTVDLLGLRNDIAANRKINLRLHQDSLIYKPLSDFLHIVHSPGVSRRFIEGARSILFDALRTISQTDLAEAKAKTTYDYFQRALVKETNERNDIIKSLEAMIK